jgi:hypothetical protein
MHGFAVPHGIAPSLLPWAASGSVTAASGPFFGSWTPDFMDSVFLSCSGHPNPALEVLNL